MAEWNIDARGAPSGRRPVPVQPGPAFDRVLRLAGTATSVALVAGLAVWSYKLAMRQLHGVPVIAAPEGPARVAPEEPGGELARYQGMAVNTIAAVGEAAETADRLMLAPRPELLTDQDLAYDALKAPDGATPAATGPAAPENRVVVPSETLAAMQPADGRIAEPLPDGAADPIFDPALTGAVAIDPEDLIPAEVPGVAASPRPRARPMGDAVAEAAALAVAAALAPAPTAEVDAGRLEPGAVLAQIGTYPTEAEARLGWDAAAARFGALFDGRKRVIQQAESGGRAFFRLRVAGFADRDEAGRFCAVLRQAGECVPAQVR